MRWSAWRRQLNNWLLVLVPTFFLFIACDFFHKRDAASDYDKSDSSAAKDSPEAESSKTSSQGTKDDPIPVKGSTLSCDKPPPTVMCCQAMIPSCESCKARAARIQADWHRLCGDLPTK